MIEQGAGGDMDDHDEGSDDGESSEIEWLHVTRAWSRHPDAFDDRRGRACYFGGHFGCSFQFVGISARASQDESEPVRRSSDGNGAAPVSRRGAAIGAALRAGA